MNIQGSLNQLLGIAAVVARTSPEYEKASKLKDLKKEQTALEARERVMLQKDTYGSDEDFANLYGELTNVKGLRFKYEPTEENYEAWVESFSTDAKRKQKLEEENKEGLERKKQQEFEESEQKRKSELRAKYAAEKAQIDLRDRVLGKRYGSINFSRHLLGGEDYE